MRANVLSYLRRGAIRTECWGGDGVILEKCHKMGGKFLEKCQKLAEIPWKSVKKICFVR